MRTSLTPPVMHRKMRHGVSLTATLVMLGALVGIAPAAMGSQSANPDGWPKAHQTGELTASDGAANDHFGASVAVSVNGRVAVVGANNQAYGLGAVYVYVHRKGAWNQVQELSEPPEGGGVENFGSAVAVSADGSTIVVGADSQGTGSWVGAAYVFNRPGKKKWVESAELTASDAQDMDFFGFSLAVSSDGGTVLVGAYGRSSNTGVAYVFSLQDGSWTQAGELTASDGAEGDLFGYDVAVSPDGSTAVVGASGSDTAYVFSEDQGAWTQTAELTGTAEYAEQSVAVSSGGSRIALGAPGKVDIFTRSGDQWIKSAEVDGTAGDLFGSAVSLSAKGDVLAVGAYRYSDTMGAAYVYRYAHKTWTQKTTLTASDGQQYDAFGAPLAVSADGSTVVVGAQDRLQDTGAAYTFRGHKPQK